VKRQQEEAAAAAARARAAAASNSAGTSTTTTTTTQSDVSTVPVSGGSFTRPAAGAVTSGFGYRSFNGGGFHYGVDIAKSGSVPIVAAADGVVNRSYNSSSYGNAIMISHSINGQTYTTVYAHLSSRTVGNMQVVSKGQERSGGERLYTFEAKEGQRLTARLISANKGAVFNVNVQYRIDTELIEEKKTKWPGLLPKAESGLYRSRSRRASAQPVTYWRSRGDKRPRSE